MTFTATACAQEADAPPSASRSQAAPSPSPLGPPELRPGHDQLTSGSHRGSADVGPVTLRKGVNWVDVNCRSDKEPESLTLTLDSVGSFTIDCPSTEDRFSVNELNLTEGRGDRLSIEVADSVQWYASVQAADPEAKQSPAP
ncbi:hypothetical protein [Streptomyces sp. cmx-18-6]|uniref:hypothetical protein n=1 Tax=Streptomyces sp. cmx-18-6 TaxID=2790930 RepID=UPI0039805C6B